MVETHSEVNFVTIKVDNEMVIIQVQVGKNIIEDVLLDGGANVNIIIKNLRTKLSLPNQDQLHITLEMTNQSMTMPLGIIKKLKIHIHGIPYVATFFFCKIMW
jgi:hypothetical protein